MCLAKHTGNRVLTHVHVQRRTPWTIVGRVGIREREPSHHMWQGRRSLLCIGPLNGRYACITALKDRKYRKEVSRYDAYQVYTIPVAG